VKFRAYENQTEKAMPKERPRILVIDNDEKVHTFIRDSLSPLNPSFHFHKSPLLGIEQAHKERPTLAIIDILNPEMDGVEVCAEFRNSDNLKDTLIAFFTTRNEDYSQIAGFNAGADDYILKPCKSAIFQSRIRALLRRFKLRPESSVPFHGIAIDRERYMLRKGDSEILLPRKEFELIALLLSSPRKVFTRKEIYNEVWGGEMDLSNRTIDVHIRKLREKIGEEHITTVKGIGYRFER
jgi:two-component system alkaline phosphatase synthesis response regulator PhoP